MQHVLVVGGDVFLYGDMKRKTESKDQNQTKTQKNLIKIVELQHYSTMLNGQKKFVVELECRFILNLSHDELLR